MSILAHFFVTLASIELALRMPIATTVRELLESMLSSRRVILSPKITDRRRERALLIYSNQIFQKSLKLLIFLVILFLPAGAIEILFFPSFSSALSHFAQWSSLLWMALISLIYLSFRLTPKVASYSLPDRWLHRILLARPIVGELLFDIERTLFLPRKDRVLSDNRAVFVIGLPRSGSTALMRTLFQSGQFASLTYRDMPFVLAPNFWHLIASNRPLPGLKSERMHGDRIEIDFDSPEAMEEVFWRTFHGSEYIKPQALIPHEIPIETLKAFREYQSLICRKYGKARYLSKNNNNLLRLRSLHSGSENSLFLIPFRAPLEQAHSLFRLHLKFQNNSPFINDYMSWLGHHEFGATHRPFEFSRRTKTGNSLKIDYWLERWIEAYSYILEILKENPPNILPVCYERLCDTPEYWGKISVAAGISVDTPASFSPPASIANPNPNVGLMKASMEIYDQLLLKSEMA